MGWLIDKLIKELLDSRKRKIAKLEDEIMGLERIFDNLSPKKQAIALDRIVELRDRIEEILRGLDD